MIVFDMVTKFPLNFLNSGIMLIVLFSNGKALQWNEINTHTHIYIYIQAAMLEAAIQRFS